MKVKTLIDKLSCYNPEREVKILCNYVDGQNGYGIRQTDIGFSETGESLIILIAENSVEEKNGKKFIHNGQ